MPPSQWSPWRETTVELLLPSQWSAWRELYMLPSPANTPSRWSLWMTERMLNADIPVHRMSVSGLFRIRGPHALSRWEKEHLRWKIIVNGKLVGGSAPIVGGVAEMSARPPGNIVGGVESVSLVQIGSIAFPPSPFLFSLDTSQLMDGTTTITFRPVIGGQDSTGDEHTISLVVRNLPRTGPGLGLHVTAGELDVWRVRAVSGPYRIAGDVMVNSPGDWDRIVGEKNKFVANPSVYVWAGPTYDYPNRIVNSSSWPSTLAGAPGSKGQPGSPEPIRDAAFYAMVAQPPDSGLILAAVKNAILEMVGSRYNDYSDTDRYSRSGFGTGFHPVFQISAWLVKLIFAYDYSQVADLQAWSESERAAFLNWVSEAARWIIPQIESRRVGMWNDDGTPSLLANQEQDRVVWAGGPSIRRAQLRYNNHVPRLVRIPTLVGILTGDEAMVDIGRRWVSEFLKVGVYPQGAIADFNRYRDGNGEPSKGWKYGMENLGSTLLIADHIARAGDVGVYEYSTIAGTIDTAGSVPDDGITSGGPKTLRSTVRQQLRYIDEDSQPVRYGCDDCSSVEYRIDSRDDVTGIMRAAEWGVLHANLYFRDPYVKSVYMRALPGTPGLPVDPRHGQGWIWNGEHGAYPGVNLMYAQMEDEVWPYPDPI